MMLACHRLTSTLLLDKFVKNSMACVPHLCLQEGKGSRGRGYM